MKKSLSEIRESIEKKQLKFRKISSLNQGVIIGAIETDELQKSIMEDMSEYNRRSKRDHYEGGIVVKNTIK